MPPACVPRDKRSPTMVNKMVNKMLRAALRYARRGWPVLPLQTASLGRCSCGDSKCNSVGKHPRTAHGLTEATTDQARIRAWWKKWPKANIGIATGSQSGVVVLDIDPRHDGEASLKLLQKRHDDLPKCPTVMTGGGGRHLYFDYPGVPVKSKSGMALGIDMRGDGGYIVAPPSRHASGKRYRWLEGAHPKDIQPPPLPKWLQRLVTSEASKATPPIGTAIPEGQRNTVLTRFAGAMRRQGASESTILVALREENKDRCNPPL